MPIITRARFSISVVELAVSLVCFAVSGALAAQDTNPDYRFEFSIQYANPTDGVRSGTLNVSVLPPQLYETNGPRNAGIPALLTFESSLYPGRWLLEGSSDQSVSEQERFVLGKFTLFQTAEQADQFQPWLDPETYSTFAESVRRGEIDLASDRELYLQYDDIRLLGSIRYGDYTLLYTQFRLAESDQVTTSVMPARFLDGRLVTAGGLHSSSHELYRMLAFGTLQRQLMIYLSEQANN